MQEHGYLIAELTKFYGLEETKCGFDTAFSIASCNAENMECLIIMCLNKVDSKYNQYVWKVGERCNTATARMICSAGGT